VRYVALGDLATTWTPDIAECVRSSVTVPETIPAVSAGTALGSSAVHQKPARTASFAMRRTFPINFYSQ
jgi:hypothetical protein